MAGRGAAVTGQASAGVPPIGMRSIPKAIGFMELELDGTIRVSEGDMANAESLAGNFSAVGYALAQLIASDMASPSAARAAGKFHRLSIIYSDFAYNVTLIGERLYIVKVPVEQQEQPLSPRLDGNGEQIVAVDTSDQQPPAAFTCGSDPSYFEDGSK